MARVLDGYNPERVFYYFEEISKIPRDSKKEKEISDYLLNWAKEKKLDVKQDEFYNILIKKPATKGYENAPVVMLQGHMDMVCEKNSDVDHDFTKDPIELVVKGDFLYANGTTLGGDNGIAVAMNLALLEDDTLEHPSLEVLITSDEETGMTGVLNLDPQYFDIKSEILINLDSEEEGIFTSSCAGGEVVEIGIENKREASKCDDFYKISIKKLSGGHSGADIHLEKGNANKLLGRLLYTIKDDIELSSISGGSKDNAIPRESFALIATKNIDKIKGEIEKHNQIFKSEFASSDPNIDISIEKSNGTSDVFTDETKNKIINTINLLPNGSQKRSTEIDLVIASNNLGVVVTNDKEVVLTSAPRSSVDTILYEFNQNLIQLSNVLGVRCSISDEYPGWEFAKESMIRELVKNTYEDITGKKAVVSAIHAGLECGFLIKKIGKLDAISMGPEMHDIHSPNEHFSISSTERSYQLLIEVLKRIKE